MHATEELNRQLLVDGYIKEQERTLTLYSIIPESIYEIIFQFQRLLEKWSTELSHQNFSITNDGQNAELMTGDASTNKTIYGDHIVKYGESFAWNVKLKKGNNCVFIAGLISNDRQHMEDHNASGTWYNSSPGGFALGCEGGYVGCGDDATTKYCDDKLLKNTGDTMEVRFKWNEIIEPSMHFIANGKDLGNALTKSIANKLLNNEKNEFRFALTIQRCSRDTTIELSVEGNEID